MELLLNSYLKTVPVNFVVNTVLIQYCVYYENTGTVFRMYGLAVMLSESTFDYHVSY